MALKSQVMSKPVTTRTKDNYSRLSRLLDSRNARLAVMGIGRVGLPLAVAAADVGFRVTGIDPSPETRKRVLQGMGAPDVDEKLLKRLLKERKLEISGDFMSLKKADVVVVCVPTPLKKHGGLDLSYIESATQQISRNMKSPSLVILESTTYPGTTEEVVKPALETGGARTGKDFFLGYSPERLDPGNGKFHIRNTTKIVSGINANSRNLTKKFYGTFVEKTYAANDTRTAEMAKLLENIFRSVNIAMINEMAQICSRMGMDIYEVLKAASTKEFGFMAFRPGPGVGGHCIPLDPYYLLWKSREFDLHPRFIQLAQDINENMPYYIERKLTEALNEEKKCLNGSKILLLGVAYKPGVSDTRESPAIKLFELLEKSGTKVSYHDNFCPEISISGKLRKSRKLTPKRLSESDAVLITTDHPDVDYSMVLENAPLVFDTRYVLRNIKHTYKGKVVWL